jgi:error-prone DNA polymerase
MKSFPWKMPLCRGELSSSGTRMTTGPHMMSFLRDQLGHVTRAIDLAKGKHGSKVTIAGVVICRQRPGTAKGHVFVSLEDETGFSNAIVRSELFEKLRLTITHEPFLEIEGQLQHLEGVVSVLARNVRGLNAPAIIKITCSTAELPSLFFDHQRLKK